jgi:ElaB/YqjD/DUF883 family membrane-anchored ribosome-binding protein
MQTLEAKYQQLTQMIKDLERVLKDYQEQSQKETEEFSQQL